MRWAEQTLPISFLTGLAWFFAALVHLPYLLTAINQFCRLRQLPESIRPHTSLWRYWHQQVILQQSTMVSFWPDRLREPRWQARCRIQGADYLGSVLESQRPVILATLHYSSNSTLYYWLRSRGRRIAALSYITLNQLPPYRQKLLLIADEANELSGVPQLFGIEDLWDARDFLSSKPNMMMFAVDAPFGHRSETIVIDDLRLRVQTGAFRMAKICEAVVLPCLIRAKRGIQVEIQFGVPVSEDLIATQNHRAAAEHTMQELLALVKNCPEQCSVALVEWLQGPKDSPLPLRSQNE